MRAAVVTTSPKSAPPLAVRPSARSVSYQNCWSSGNSSGLMATVSVVLIVSSFLPAFPPVLAGRPGARLPPGCVSGHHATDVIEAAGGIGGDAVLPGGPVRIWAAGRGGYPARLEVVYRSAVRSIRRRSWSASSALYLSS